MFRRLSRPLLISAVLTIAAFMTFTSSQADTPPIDSGTQDANPYIRLYQSRATAARARVAQAEAEAEFARRVYEREQHLYAQQATSLEELQRAQAEYLRDGARIATEKARVAEADALVDIVKLKVAAGEQVAICTEDL